MRLSFIYLALLLTTTYLLVFITWLYFTYTFKSPKRLSFFFSFFPLFFWFQFSQRFRVTRRRFICLVTFSSSFMTMSRPSPNHGPIRKCTIKSFVCVNCYFLPSKELLPQDVRCFLLLLSFPTALFVFLVPSSPFLSTRLSCPQPLTRFWCIFWRQPQGLWNRYERSVTSLAFKRIYARMSCPILSYPVLSCPVLSDPSSVLACLSIASARAVAVGEKRVAARYIVLDWLMYVCISICMCVRCVGVCMRV